MTIFFLFLFTRQQRVDYNIKTNLDIENKILNIDEIIIYYNNSPTTLDTLYFHLYANAYRDNNTTFAREIKKMGGKKFLEAKKSERGWIDIRSVIADKDSLQFIITETIMSVVLNKPLQTGDSIILKIDGVLKIPKIFSRLGYKGEHFEIVQWYPKPCVFDDKGWHRQGYHAIGEFYGEFGKFDVSIELPENYVVAATGILIDSNYVVNNRKIMHYIARDVHDFAWVCDPEFEIEKREVDGITIEIYYIKKYKKKWKKAGDYAIDALTRYNKWFGKYPYKKLSVVQGYFGEGMEYPNLVIIGGSEDNLTRNFEIVIIHEIAHQWFYGVLGSNEIDEAWLDEGFTSYTEARYFVDKYGVDNSFFKSGFIPKMPHNYTSRMVYYINLTNQIERPVLTKAYEFVDIPIAYQNATYSKPALFLRYLEGYVGANTFDRILKEYFERYKFKHPNSEDFVTLCEEISEKHLKIFFEDFLHTTKYCDWHIKKINKNSLIIENRGEFLLPVDILVQTDKGGEVVRVDKTLDTIIFPMVNNIKRVIIDPYDYTPEADRFNNFYPKKIAIKPIFSWPSFDTYQVLYLPYLCYDSFDGFTPGIYLAGMQFIDFDFIKGRHNWIFGYIYGTRRQKHNYNFSYQTPLIFKEGYRMRIFFKGSNSNDELKYQAGLINNFGIPFTTKPRITLKNYLSYNELKSYDYVDSIDWSTGRYYLLQNHLTCSLNEWFIGFNISGSYFSEDRNFIKGTFELEHTYKLLLPTVYTRFFAGKILGEAPNQEKIFLCGALRHNFITDLFFGQKGYASPQEHIHIKQDGNLAGYQGYHLKTDGLFSVNIQFPERLPIRVFGDFGYYYDRENSDWRYAYDAGVKFTLGPIGFILPLYNHIDKFWPKNWSVEIIGSGID